MESWSDPRVWRIMGKPTFSQKWKYETRLIRVAEKIYFQQLPIFLWKKNQLLPRSLSTPGNNAGLVELYLRIFSFSKLILFSPFHFLNNSEKSSLAHGTKPSNHIPKYLVILRSSANEYCEENHRCWRFCIVGMQQSFVFSLNIYQTNRSNEKNLSNNLEMKIPAIYRITKLRINRKKRQCVPWSNLNIIRTQQSHSDPT